MEKSDLILPFLSDDPRPQGGDTGSWFYHYKFRPGEDTLLFVPVSKTTFPDADFPAGTLLWFVMDEVLVGVVPILEVKEDLFNDRLEIWYNGKNIVTASCPITDAVLDRIQSGELWKQLSEKPSSAPQLNS